MNPRFNLVSRRALLAGAVCVFGAWLSVAARPQAESKDALTALKYPRTIVLVRHGEKTLEPKEDPNLTEAGAERAARLSSLFAKSGVTHVFASEFQRTQQTVAVLAVTSGVNVDIVSARQPDALLSSLDSLPRHSFAVVAGHSNTVPALLERLTGGQTKVKIEESEYDRLFIVTQWGPGKDSRAIELRY